MTLKTIMPGVTAIRTIDWDRRLFDELIPLPEGTTYNAYLVEGTEKTALIDSSDPRKELELIENLKTLNVKKIDYIVSHHGEQDHSGAIPRLLSIYPEARVVTNSKCKDMLKNLLLIPDDKFIEVADRQVLNLGGKTLEFILTPWVHWPETMTTYLKEGGILFSCDFFGSHLCTSEAFVEDEHAVYESAKRYYAEIMMPFRPAILKNLEKIKPLGIKVIAPSHGPMYQKPELIVNAYTEWVSDSVKNEVVIPFISMHGSTRVMVDYLVDALIRRDITVKPFNLSASDIGELAMSLVDAATVVIGSPTVLAGAHPVVAYAASLANALRPKTRFASIIGSFGWGGKMKEHIVSMLPNLKVELIEPVIIKGYPRESDFKLLDTLADNISHKHKDAGI